MENPHRLNSSEFCPRCGELVKPLLVYNASHEYREDVELLVECPDCENRWKVGIENARD
jgi:DNA-directed RNA polymerase subunit M/transcription elongation factor TFIIS